MPDRAAFSGPFGEICGLAAELPIRPSVGESLLLFSGARFKGKFVVMSGETIGKRPPLPKPLARLSHQSGNQVIWGSRNWNHEGKGADGAGVSDLWESKRVSCRMVGLRIA